jgi:hypothetical protein
MPNPGYSNINNHVLMSLNNMAQIKFGRSQSLGMDIVKLGPGLRWGAVYKYLSTYGLGVSGGRYAPVGVPGLLLGGGISDFGSRRGKSKLKKSSQ